MRTLTVVLYGVASPGLGACCTSSASIAESRQAGSPSTPSRRMEPLRFPAISVETFGAGPFGCAFPLTAPRQQTSIGIRMYCQSGWAVPRKKTVALLHIYLLRVRFRDESEPKYSIP